MPATRKFDHLHTVGPSQGGATELGGDGLSEEACSALAEE